MKNELPLVSIICTTYNHEKFIAQTLDGFIFQKTSFPFEIIIHDDASTDNTAAIIKEYEAKYPNLFVSIYQTENQFSKKKVNIWGDITFPLAKGKYIALCEGDDYWIDPLKLQKQVDFLEANPDFAICYHRVYEERENEARRLDAHNTSTEEKTYTINDLALGNFIHTPSVIFRNNLFDKFPDWFLAANVGDFILHMLNARHGKIKYLPDLMAVYRVHAGGMWTTATNVMRRKGTIFVTSSLLNEGFSDETKEKLKTLQRVTITLLLSELSKTDLDEFLVNLKIYCEEDEVLRNEWCYGFFMQRYREFEAMKKARSYWLATKIDALLKMNPFKKKR